jgi:hypothetical protein
MTQSEATVADWLSWERSDRHTAWTGLHDIAATVARGVGSHLKLQSADSDDLAADTFCHAVDSGCARLHGLNGRIPLPAWLQGVAWCLALERHCARSKIALAEHYSETGHRAAPQFTDMESRSSALWQFVGAFVPRPCAPTDVHGELGAEFLDGLSGRVLSGRPRVFPRTARVTSLRTCGRASEVTDAAALHEALAAYVEAARRTAGLSIATAPLESAVDVTPCVVLLRRRSEHRRRQRH